MARRARRRRGGAGRLATASCPAPPRRSRRAAPRPRAPSRAGGRIGREQALQQGRRLRRGPGLAGHDQAPRARCGPVSSESSTIAEAVEVVRRRPPSPHGARISGPPSGRIATASGRSAPCAAPASCTGASASASSAQKSRARRAGQGGGGQRVRLRAARRSRAARARSRPTRPARRSAACGASAAHGAAGGVERRARQGWAPPPVRRGRRPRGPL